MVVAACSLALAGCSGGSTSRSAASTAHPDGDALNHGRRRATVAGRHFHGGAGCRLARACHPRRRPGAKRGHLGPVRRRVSQRSHACGPLSGRHASRNASTVQRGGPLHARRRATGLQRAQSTNVQLSQDPRDDARGGRHPRHVDADPAAQRPRMAHRDARGPWHRQRAGTHLHLDRHLRVRGRLAGRRLYANASSTSIQAAKRIATLEARQLQAAAHG